MWVKLDPYRYQNVATAQGIVIRVAEQQTPESPGATIVLIGSDGTEYILLELVANLQLDDKLVKHTKSIESLINGELKLWDLSTDPDVIFVDSRLEFQD